MVREEKPLGFNYRPRTLRMTACVSCSLWIAECAGLAKSEEMIVH